MNMTIRMYFIAFTLLPASLAFAGGEMRYPQQPWSMPHTNTTQQAGTVPTTEMETTHERVSNQQAGTVPSEQLSLDHLNQSMILNFIHHLNSKEMMASEEALGKIQNAELRRVVEVLMNDHNQNEDRLTQLAEQMNVTLGKFEPATHETTVMNELRMLNGMNFDKAFWRVQSQCYQEAIQSLRLMQASVTNADLQSFINMTISTLESHLKDISALHMDVE